MIGQLDEENYKELKVGIEKAADAVEVFLKDGIDIAMNKFN